MIPGIVAGGGGFSAVGVLPPIADENATFENNGDATGWTLTNGTNAASAGWVRLTKTTGGSSSLMSRSVTLPASNRDFILYGKVRAQYTGSNVGYIWLSDGSRYLALIMGANATESGPLAGSIVMRGTNSGGSFVYSQLATGVDYSTTIVDFALQFDSKYGYVNAWFRELDGRWKFKGRVQHQWFLPTQIMVAAGSASASGAWIEFDHLIVARPNIIVIGDSIAAGATGYNPNPASALTNDESTWMRHSPIYPALRNNLIVNKGVGSQTSGDFLARIATDVTNHGPRACILHGSTNDSLLGVSLATRTSNVQSTINAVKAASAEVVLINAMYGTSSNASNPGLRNYMLDWWDNYRPGLSSLYGSLDIMQPILSGGFMAAGLTQPDNIHPNVSGYTAIGAAIAAQPYGT
jgi:lysophospholipase L1-like esterase